MLTDPKRFGIKFFMEEHERRESSRLQSSSVPPASGSIPTSEVVGISSSTLAITSVLPIKLEKEKLKHRPLPHLSSNARQSKRQCTRLESCVVPPLLPTHLESMGDSSGSASAAPEEQLSATKQRRNSLQASMAQHVEYHKKMYVDFFFFFFASSFFFSPCYCCVFFFFSRGIALHFFCLSSLGFLCLLQVGESQQPSLKVLLHSVAVVNTVINIVWWSNNRWRVCGRCN